MKLNSAIMKYFDFSLSHYLSQFYKIIINHYISSLTVYKDLYILKCQTWIIPISVGIIIIIKCSLCENAFVLDLFSVPHLLFLFIIYCCGCFCCYLKKMVKCQMLCFNYRSNLSLKQYFFSLEALLLSLYQTFVLCNA